MLIISKPICECNGSLARVIARFTSNNIDKDIFLETSIEWAQYLTSDVSDAFVIGALLPALISGEDLEVDSVSDYLYYNFPTLSYLLSKVFGVNAIKLHTKNIVHTDWQPTAIGTGFSGGVDSLCSYINHTKFDCPESMRITHLTLFNVGAYGNDYEQSYIDFSNDLKRAKNFAQEVGMPLVSLNSNISSIYTDKKIVHYSLRSTLSLAVGILAFQKLFKIYYISSTGTIDDMKLNNLDQYYYESSLVQRLGNHHLDILIAEHDINRVEKMRILVDNVYAQKHLYVCAADIYNSKRGTNYKKDTSPNCCECIKCTRTLLALDFMEALDKFASRFDLEKWKRVRDQEIARMFIRKERDHFAAENWELFCSNGGQLTVKQEALIKQGHLW